MSTRELKQRVAALSSMRVQSELAGTHTCKGDVTEPRESRIRWFLPLHRLVYQRKVSRAWHTLEGGTRVEPVSPHSLYFMP